MQSEVSLCGLITVAPNPLGAHDAFTAAKAATQARQALIVPSHVSPCSLIAATVLSVRTLTNRKTAVCREQNSGKHDGRRHAAQSNAHPPHHAKIATPNQVVLAGAARAVPAPGPSAHNTLGANPGKIIGPGN